MNDEGIWMHKQLSRQKKKKDNQTHTHRATGGQVDEAGRLIDIPNRFRKAKVNEQISIHRQMDLVVDIEKMKLDVTRLDVRNTNRWHG